MTEVVILDFDGVILESVDIKGWAFSELFKEHPEHRQAILDYHYANGGMPRFDKFRHIYSQILALPLSEEKFNELGRDYADLVVKKVLAVDFVPGAREFLEQACRRADLFIVSGTPEAEIRNIVHARNLAGFLKGVYGSPMGKGHWTAKILADGPYDPARAVWVGDALSDWQAAADHGIRFVGRVFPHTDIFADRPLWRKVPDLREMDFIFR